MMSEILEFKTGDTPIFGVALNLEEETLSIDSEVSLNKEEELILDTDLDDSSFTEELSLDEHITQDNNDTIELPLDIEEELELPNFDETPIETLTQEESLTEDIYEDDTPEIPTVSSYDADILLAKKSSFENRLFKSILDDLGYTSVIVNGKDELQVAISTQNFKLVLFDKETDGVYTSEISQSIKDRGLDTALVLMIDPALDVDPADTSFVHEIIKNIVNKDLLRLVFEKFI